MKKIFDQASLYNYMQSVQRDNKLDNIGLTIILALSVLFLFNIIGPAVYKYSLTLLFTVKVFLILNTKSKIKNYAVKFNDFYNGEENVQ